MPFCDLRNIYRNTNLYKINRRDYFLFLKLSSEP